MSLRGTMTHKYAFRIEEISCEQASALTLWPAQLCFRLSWYVVETMMNDIDPRSCLFFCICFPFVVGVFFWCSVCYWMQADKHQFGQLFAILYLALLADPQISAFGRSKVSPKPTKMKLMNEAITKLLTLCHYGAMVSKTSPKMMLLGPPWDAHFY